MQNVAFVRRYCVDFSIEKKIVFCLADTLLNKELNE